MRIARSEVRLLRDCARSLRIFAQCNYADATLVNSLALMTDSRRSSLTSALESGLRLLAAGATEEEALGAVRAGIPHARGEALVSTIVHIRTFGTKGIAVCDSLAQQCEHDAEQVLQRRTGIAQIRFSMRVIGAVLVGTLCLVVVGAARGNVAGILLAVFPALCIAAVGAFAVHRLLRPPQEATISQRPPEVGNVVLARLRQALVVIPLLAGAVVVLKIPSRAFLLLCISGAAVVVYEWLVAQRSISRYESVLDVQLCGVVAAMHAHVLAGSDVFAAFDAACVACENPLRSELGDVVVRRQLGDSTALADIASQHQGIIDLICIVQLHQASGTSPTAALNALGTWLNDRQGRARIERNATLAPRLQLVVAFFFVPAVLWVMLVVVARQFSQLGGQL